MSGYPEHTIQRVLKSGDLQSICYNAPYTATQQEIWEMIRIRKENNLVYVDAVSHWTASADGPSGKNRYQTKYQINPETVTVVAHKKLFGLAGNDTFIGSDGDNRHLGGSGTNPLIGGLGGDIYFIESAGDTLENDPLAAGVIRRPGTKVPYTRSSTPDSFVTERNVDATGTAQAVGRVEKSYRLAA